MRIPNLSAVLVLFNGALQRFLPFVVSAVISAVAGAEQFALFAFLLATANTISALCSLGYSPFILSTLGVAAKGDLSSLQKRMRSIQMASVSIALIAFVAALAMQISGIKSLAGDRQLLALAMLAPGLILLQSSQSTYFALGKYVPFTRINLAAVASFAVLALLMMAARSEKHIALLYSAFILLTGIVMTGKMWVGPAESEEESVFAQITQVLRQSLPFFGYTGVWMVSIYVCNVFVSSRFDVAALAAYNLAYQLFSVFLTIPSMLGGVVIPKLAGSEHKGGGAQYVKDLALRYLLVAMFVLPLLWMFSPQILNLYKIDSTPEHVEVLRLMLLAGACATVITPLLQALMAASRLKTLYKIAATWVIAVIPGLFLLAHSVRDAAQWFLIGYLCVTILSLYFWRRLAVVD